MALREFKDREHLSSSSKPRCSKPRSKPDARGIARTGSFQSILLRVRGLLARRRHRTRRPAPLWRARNCLSRNANQAALGESRMVAPRPRRGDATPPIMVKPKPITKIRRRRATGRNRN